jgi:uncharacterized protein (DUF2141 family)
MKKIFFLSVWLIPLLLSAQDSIVYKASNREFKSGKRSIETKEGRHSISITVRNIRNHEGVIRFKFFDDSTPFPHEMGFRKIVVPKSMVTGDSLCVTYDGFLSQNMGIALLDDENSNWKLDVGWFFPKEGHAFSDYYHTSLRKPVYKDFRFLLVGDKNVIMKMRYY